MTASLGNNNNDNGDNNNGDNNNNINGQQLISVHPDELNFLFELEKQSFCDLKVVNNTEHHVAFKVKTTSPKKYFVRPNTGVLQPWDSCIIRVSLQAQKEYPPDFQCKDKFLLQSTRVAPDIDTDDLPHDTFIKDGGRAVEECKLRVVYTSPVSAQPNSVDDLFKPSLRSPARVLDASSSQEVQQLKEERDMIVRQSQQLQLELDLLKRRKVRKVNPGFSLTFAIFVGLIGLMVGFLFSLLLSSPTAT